MVRIVEFVNGLRPIEGRFALGWRFGASDLKLNVEHPTSNVGRSMFDVHFFSVNLTFELSALNFSSP
jgi:hypothetical protein